MSKLPATQMRRTGCLYESRLPISLPHCVPRTDFGVDCPQQRRSRAHITNTVSILTGTRAILDVRRRYAWSFYASCPRHRAMQRSPARREAHHQTKRPARPVRRAVLGEPASVQTDRPSVNETVEGLPAADSRAPVRGRAAQQERAPLPKKHAHTRDPSASADAPTGPEPVPRLRVHSPFAASEPVTTAAVVSHLITLQRMHRGTRNQPIHFMQLTDLLLQTVHELLARLPERNGKPLKVSVTDLTHTPEEKAMVWSDELCEHVLITVALFSNVFAVRAVRALSTACATYLVQSSRAQAAASTAALKNQCGSDSPIETGELADALDVVARRARLAGLLMNLHRQGHDEDAFVRDILAAYDAAETGGSRSATRDACRVADAEEVQRVEPAGHTTGPQQTCTDPDARDDYLFSSLLPDLYRVLSRLCTSASVQNAAASGHDSGSPHTPPVTAEKLEVFSRVCSVLSRAVQYDLVRVESALPPGEHSECPCASSAIVVFGPRTDSALCDRRVARAVTALPLSAFMLAVQRQAAGVLAEHTVKRIMLRDAHAPNVEEQLMPAKGTPHSHRTSSGRAATDWGLNFRVDTVLPVLQLVVSPHAFAQLFTPIDEKILSVADHAALVHTTSRSVHSLLHVAIQWAPTLQSFQVASVASLYSRTLLSSHSAEGIERSALQRPTTSAAQTCAAIQEEVLHEVRRGLLPPSSFAFTEDAWLRAEGGDEPVLRHPGLVAMRLLEAVQRRLSKYFASDLASFVTALHDIHGVLHALEVDHSVDAGTERAASRAANAEHVAALSPPPASRFTRKSKTRSPTAAMTAGAASTPSTRSGASASTGFDWVQYETTLQVVTSSALAHLGMLASRNRVPYWRVLISSSSAAKLSTCLPPHFCITSTLRSPPLTQATASDAVDLLVYLRLPSSLLVAAGRSKDALGHHQGHTLTPHELVLLTRTLAAFTRHPSSTALSAADWTAPAQGHVRGVSLTGNQEGGGGGVSRTCSSHRAAYYPLTSLNMCKPHAWRGVLDQSLVGSLEAYLGVYDHQGVALAQILACRLGLLPLEYANDDFNRHHYWLCVVLMAHGTTALTVAEFVDTLSPLCAHPLEGSIGSSWRDLLCTVRREQPLREAALFNVHFSVPNRFLRRMSSYFSIADALAILVTLVAQTALRSRFRCLSLCFALWTQIARVHRTELAYLLNGAATDHANDVEAGEACARFVASVLTPFFIVSRAVLWQVETLLAAVSPLTGPDVASPPSTGGVQAAHRARTETRVKALRVLHDVLLVAVTRASDLARDSALSSSLSPSALVQQSQPQPLWYVMCLCELLQRCDTPDGRGRDDGGAPARHASLTAVPVAVRQYIDMYLSDTLTHRSVEEIALTLTSVAARQYGARHSQSETPDEATPVGTVPPVVRASLAIAATFDAVSRPSRRASLHYFTLLPFVLALDAEHASAQHVPLRDPLALLTDIAARIGTACVTVDALVFVLQQLSLVDAALLTGDMLTAPHWTHAGTDTTNTSDVRSVLLDEAHGRVGAALYCSITRLIVAPLDAAAEKAAQRTAMATQEDDGIGDPDGDWRLAQGVRSLSFHEWPFSLVDLLHLVVLLIEAEAAGSAPRSSLASHRTKAAGSRGLLVSLQHLKRRSVLRHALTDDVVRRTLTRTRERDVVPELLLRAVRGLAACHSALVQRAGTDLISPFLTFFMQRYFTCEREGLWTGTRSNSGVSHPSASPPQEDSGDGDSSHEIFLSTLHYLAALDVDVLTDVVHRASSSPLTVEPPHRHRGVSSDRGRSSRRVPHSLLDAQAAHARLTSLLMLSLYLFRHDAKAGLSDSTLIDREDEDGKPRNKLVHTQPRMQHLAFRLLRRGSRLLSTQWRTWMRYSDTHACAQLLADLIDMPVTHTNHMFVWFAVKSLLYVHKRNDIHTAALTITEAAEVAVAGGTMLGDSQSEHPWLSTATLLSAVDDEEDGHTGNTCDNLCPLWVSPARPALSSTESRPQPLVMFNAERHGAAPFSSLPASQQYKVRQQIARRGPPLKGIRLSVRAYLCVLFKDKFALSRPRARLMGVPMGRLLLHRADHMTLFFRMRTTDVRRLRRQVGPVDFLLLATSVLERYLFDLSADARSEVDAMENVFAAFDGRAGEDKFSHGKRESDTEETRTDKDTPRDEAARQGRRLRDAICACLAQVSCGASGHIEAAALRWSSAILQRWLREAVDIVVRLQSEEGLQSLRCELNRVDSDPKEADTIGSGAFAAPSHSHNRHHANRSGEKRDEEKEEESFGSVLPRGDAEEQPTYEARRSGASESVDRARHQCFPRSTETASEKCQSYPLHAPQSRTLPLTVDFAVVERFLRLIESLCPSLAPDLSEWVEHTGHAGPPSPTALILAAVAHTTLGVAVASAESRAADLQVSIHNLVRLLTFRQREHAALVEAQREAEAYQQCRFPLTEGAAHTPAREPRASPHITSFEVRFATLRNERVTVELAILTRVFPCVVRREATDAPDGPVASVAARERRDRALLARHVHRVTASLDADDVAQLMQLLTQYAASQTTREGTDTMTWAYEQYVVILCDTLTELLPSLRGRTMKTIVQVLLPLIAACHAQNSPDADVCADRSHTAHHPLSRQQLVLQRGLTRLCAHIAPLVAHDVSRLTRDELAYVLACLHTPVLSHSMSVDGDLMPSSPQEVSRTGVQSRLVSAAARHGEDTQADSTVANIFAQSLVSKEAARAIRRALEAQSTGVDTSDTPAEAARDASEVEEDQQGEAEWDSAMPATTLTGPSRGLTRSNEAAIELRWCRLLRVLFTQDETTSLSPSHVDEILQLVEETAL